MPSTLATRADLFVSAAFTRTGPDGTVGIHLLLLSKVLNRIHIAEVVTSTTLVAVPLTCTGKDPCVPVVSEILASLAAWYKVART